MLKVSNHWVLVNCGLRKEADGLYFVDGFLDSRLRGNDKRA